ncbi:VPS35 endosomal protein sorting factor-like [Neltuma alba]|uniref:VPS35 endosomal protein sorting factor-like n=1 Tax=Neltuma alba TaxID=207710 RepID=UPI0010A47978|nr:VPS35 endosomal protein sorting factor-like [Prosopis alba]
MEFRPRTYGAYHSSHVLPRFPTDSHPFAAPSISDIQVDAVDLGNHEFLDPLRRLDGDAKAIPFDHEMPSEAAIHPPMKEWSSFRRLLQQRFPVSKMVSLSSVPEVMMRSGKSLEKSSSMHMEELDDPQKFADDEVKVIAWQEYVSRLHELKDEIAHSWLVDDRITSLKLSVKVAKLLVDTSILQFYPTLFVLVTDIMDMLGDLVWQRIKQKAKFSADGTLLGSLPENFKAVDICSDAKETCNNWFSKIGAVRELLPRIYLELAILPCWRFLLDEPLDSLKRLVMMTRGLGDPVAFAYCHLYMAHCAQKLPSHDIGYLVTCLNDLRVILIRILSPNGSIYGDKRKLFVSLMEPTIEYVMNCIFKGMSQMQINDVLPELGLRKNQQSSSNVTYVSVVLHHLLKELPIEVIFSNTIEILHLIECSEDKSYDQHMNYRLLGFRLNERRCPCDIAKAVLDKVIQVVEQYDSLHQYLKVVDAYADLILQNGMDNLLETILEGISRRAYKGVMEDEMLSLQSLLVKLLSHFKCLEDVFLLNHFPKILDITHGNTRNVVFMHMLDMATRNCRIRHPTTIQLLYEISQTLHDDMEFMNVKDDDSHVSRLISRFVHMVDYGADLERQLAFLVDSRGAFSRLDELKETLVHSSNCLAIQALRSKKHLIFVKSCITFSEITVPSISSQRRQFDLLLETAEVALQGGLFSHSDELIDSAIGCLQSSDIMDG